MTEGEDQQELPRAVDTGWLTWTQSQPASSGMSSPRGSWRGWLAFGLVVFGVAGGLAGAVLGAKIGSTFAPPAQTDSIGMSGFDQAIYGGLIGMFVGAIGLPLVVSLLVALFMGRRRAPGTEPSESPTPPTRDPWFGP